MLYLYSI